MSHNTVYNALRPQVFVEKAQHCYCYYEAKDTAYTADECLTATQHASWERTSWTYLIQDLFH